MADTDSNPHQDGKHQVGASAEVRVLELRQEVIEFFTRGTALHAEGDLNEDQEEGNNPSNKRPSDAEADDTKQDEGHDGQKTAPLAVERKVSGADFVDDRHIVVVLFL